MNTVTTLRMKKVRGLSLTLRNHQDLQLRYDVYKTIINEASLRTVPTNKEVFLCGL